jgi:multicomponent Na+:H+ antiporter subunit E
MRRIAFLVVLAAVIFEMRPGALVPAALAALLALIAARRLPAVAPLPLRPLRLLGFLPWFGVQAVRGGADVALRAFRGSTAVRPDFVEYRTRIRHPAGRVVLASTVGLLPGTFVSRLEGDRLVVHRLHSSMPVERMLVELEARLAPVLDEEGGA